MSFYTMFFVVSKNGTMSPTVDLKAIEVKETIPVICDREGLQYIKNPQDAILIDADYNAVNGVPARFKSFQEFDAQNESTDVWAICGSQLFPDLYKTATAIRIAYFDKNLVGQKIPLPIESENYGAALTTSLTATGWDHADTTYETGENPHYLMHFRRKGAEV